MFWYIFADKIIIIRKLTVRIFWCYEHRSKQQQHTNPLHVTCYCFKAMWIVLLNRRDFIAIIVSSPVQFNSLSCMNCLLSFSNMLHSYLCSWHSFQAFFCVNTACLKRDLLLGTLPSVTQMSFVNTIPLRSLDATSIIVRNHLHYETRTSVAYE